MTVLREFRPGLWLTELDLDEFQVRGAVIVGATRALIWDTLSHPRDMAPVRELIGGKAHIVAYSHADWDHVWGTAGLGPDRPIVAHDACRARFVTDVPEMLAQKQAGAPDRWRTVELLPPTVTFPDRLSLDLGEVTVELHHLPGHTADCLVAFLPEWGMLLAGDTVETPYPIVNDGAALGGWVRRLETWANDHRVETVIPCHGEIGGREIIRRNIRYLNGLRRGKDPLPAADLPDDLSAFYAAGHRENLEKARAAGAGIRPVAVSEKARIRTFVVEQWGDARQVVNGEHFYPDDFPGLIAVQGDEIVGYVSYRIREEGGEILLLNSLHEGRGIARRLVDAVVEEARLAGCRSVTVVTTNDNLPALRFYQRYGFVFKAVRPGAVDISRMVKHNIATVGVDGIPIHDELELELKLA